MIVLYWRVLWLWYNWGYWLGLLVIFYLILIWWWFWLGMLVGWIWMEGYVEWILMVLRIVLLLFWFKYRLRVLNICCFIKCGSLIWCFFSIVMLDVLMLRNLWCWIINWLECKLWIMLELLVVFRIFMYKCVL